MEWRNTGRLCIAAFAMDMANTICMVALPFLALSLGGTSMDLGTLGALRGASYVVACILVSRLADRYDRRLLIGLCGVAMVVAYVLLASCGRLWQVLACSVLWAAVLSPFWPSIFSWVGDSHTEKQLGAATGAVTISWSLGSMFGGILGGWLFAQSARRPFLVAIVPALLACAIVVLSRCPHRQAKPVAPVPARPGARRGLAAAWLSTISACALLGLIGGVFPELAQNVGIGPSLFGLLMAGVALGRTAMFLVGCRWTAWLRAWRTCVVLQLAAALAVASIARCTHVGWLAVVFLIAGLNMGVCYYRGLYQSLEAPGSRGRKSGIFEASVLGGVLLGTLGGGWIAETWGLRAPYVPMAVFTVLLLALQWALQASSHTAAGRQAGSIQGQCRSLND